MFTWPTLTIDQGADWAQVMRWTADGELVALSGYTGRMQIRTSAESAEVVLELTTDNGRMTLDDTTNITLQLDNATTAALTARGYVADIELVNGGVVTRLAGGPIVVTREITRST